MSTEYDCAFDNYHNFRYCYENGHQDWLQRAARCIRFRNNDQWDPLDKAKLKKAMRPALTFNVIESLLSSMKGIQRAMRNDVRFSPVSDVGNDAAQVQDAVWLHVQNDNAMDFLETEVWERGLVTGRAYYDVRMDFNRNMRGDVRVSGLRAQDVILDPCIDQYDPETWPQVIVARWVNLLEIRHMFGKDKADKLRYQGIPSWYDYEDELLGSQMARIPYFTGGWELGVDRELVRAMRIIDRQWLKLVRKEVFVDISTGDTSEIPENWERAKIAHVLQSTPGLSTMKMEVKQIMWTLTCEDVVLHEEESPYKFFTVVPFFPKFYDGFTLSPVETMLDAQELYNKVTSQELHIINTTANSGYKVKQGSVKNMTLEEMEVAGAKSGVVFELDDVNNLEKIQPNQVPAGHDRISMKADQIMRNLGGVSNQSRGFAREDVASEAILANQAARDVNFADMMAKLHRSRQLVAKRAQDCWQNFYTETRVLMINKGSTFKPEFQSLTLNQPTAEGQVLNDVTQGEYTTVLVPSPARTTLSESEFTQLVELRRDLGIQIPDAVLIELSNIPNKGQLLQQMQGDSNGPQAQMQALEMRLKQLEASVLEGKAQKEVSAAHLNEARAAKAAGEAGKDPDAAYERIESARIASEHALGQQKIALQAQSDQQKHINAMTDSMQRRQDSQSHTALELTKVDAQMHQHRVDKHIDLHKHHTQMEHESQENEAQQAHDKQIQKSKPKPKSETAHG